VCRNRVVFPPALTARNYVTKSEFNAAIGKLSTQIAALGGQAPEATPTIEQLDEACEVARKARRENVRQDDARSGAWR